MVVLMFHPPSPPHLPASSARFMVPLFLSWAACWLYQMHFKPRQNLRFPWLYVNPLPRTDWRFLLYSIKCQHLPFCCSFFLLHPYLIHKWVLMVPFPSVLFSLASSLCLLPAEFNLPVFHLPFSARGHSSTDSISFRSGLVTVQPPQTDKRNAFKM